MIYIYSVIFGIVQGLTEFFPVSSSGHLLITHTLFPVFTGVLALPFDAALHLATLAIIFIFYGKDFFRYAKAFFFFGTAEDRRMAWMIIIATIPAAVVGVLFEDVIAERTRNLSLVASMLIFGGVLFFAVERWGSRSVSFESLTMKQAIGIGCAQVFALIPGVSRSGSTIIAGLALGLKRETATHFSFLLAAPIIAGAGLKSLFDLLRNSAVPSGGFIIFITGFVTAMLVGALCIRYLLTHVKTKTFLPFAVYRIVLGVLLLGIIFFQN